MDGLKNLYIFSLALIFILSYIPFMEYKKCSVELTDECSEWLLSLNQAEQVDVFASIGLLEQLGFNLGHPHSSKINGSKHSHMRELRIQHKGYPYRILYAFDPRRMAILLIGGNKTSDKRWYKKFIKQADKLYNNHITSLEDS